MSQTTLTVIATYFQTQFGEQKGLAACVDIKNTQFKAFFLRSRDNNVPKGVWVVFALRVPWINSPAFFHTFLARDNFQE